MPVLAPVLRPPAPAVRPADRELERLRSAVLAAQTAVEGAKQKCLAAGQLLNELRARLAHGEFTPWLAQYVPEISADTAQRWMRAAANITKALPPPEEAADEETPPVSEILATPDRELSPGQLRYKQSWLGFTADKSIKECLAAVLVEGDQAHRVDRAVNGKVLGGTGRADDRRDFPVFIAAKLKDIAAHLTHYPRMPAGQRKEIDELLRTAMLGGEIRLTRAARSRRFVYHAWPEAPVRIAFDTAKERLRGPAAKPATDAP